VKISQKQVTTVHKNHIFHKNKKLQDSKSKNMLGRNIQGLTKYLSFFYNFSMSYIHHHLTDD